MPERVVVAEILDSLPANDPDAIRTRRDLRLVNLLMGNERWVCRSIAPFREIAVAHGIVEIGAGDGALCEKLAKRHPAAAVAGYDLAPRPGNLSQNVAWHRGDIFDAPAPKSSGVLVANLFLHHFEKPELARLGRWLENFRVVIINEPDRHPRPHRLARLMKPWVNQVTQHDMRVSIDAGFTAGEMLQLLGLNASRWQFRETSTWRGARRVIAWRV
jgi:trans-aconitate methyltransferase